MFDPYPSVRKRCAYAGGKYFEESLALHHKHDLPISPALYKQNADDSDWSRFQPTIMRCIPIKDVSPNDVRVEKLRGLWEQIDGQQDIAANDRGSKQPPITTQRRPPGPV